jgi:hypothetical protein
LNTHDPGAGPDRADAGRGIAFHPGAKVQKWGRPMTIYASAVALWFMAIALFLTGASIRALFGSARAHETGARG